jgi:hypothetical protein
MTITRARNVAWRKIVNETIVLHISRKMMYGLNQAGGEVWEALEEPADARRLLEMGETTAVRAFLADLAAEGLVVGELPPVGPGAENDVAEEACAQNPRVEWREEVERIAGACVKFPGQSDLCNQAPQNS